MECVISLHLRSANLIWDFGSAEPLTWGTLSSALMFLGQRQNKMFPPFKEERNPGGGTNTMTAAPEGAVHMFNVCFSLIWLRWEKPLRSHC